MSQAFQDMLESMLPLRSRSMRWWVKTAVKAMFIGATFGGACWLLGVKAFFGVLLMIWAHNVEKH